MELHVLRFESLEFEGVDPDPEPNEPLFILGVRSLGCRSLCRQPA